MSLQQQRVMDLEYALAKQVPAMEEGFHILTKYGDIRIGPEQAPAVINAVRKVILQQLKTMKAQN
ncbi:hypothetical protein M2318_004881 [Metapseudomonas resinovorans]|uniref:hypothetical protein n=1 Tax=Metapseudomonas resinovorans TaxID=53412 RepID=UPI003D1B3C87